MTKLFVEGVDMKRLLLPAVFGFGLLMLLGCVAYPYTYSRSVGYYGYAPSYDFNYGYQLLAPIEN